MAAVSCLCCFFLGQKTAMKEGDKREFKQTCSSIPMSQGVI